MGYLSSVGLDVHARSVKAAAIVAESGELIEKSFTYCPQDIASWMHSLPQPVQAIYEAGPTGFDLARKLESLGVTCFVGATSKMLRPAGDKIKTDRRDACFLARMLLSSNIVEVYIPTPETEACRNLVRAREALRADLTAAKARLSKFLLSKGIVYGSGRRTWTVAHSRWLDSLHFDWQAERIVFEELRIAIAQKIRQKERLDAAIEEMAASPAFKACVSALCLIKGIGTLSALALVSEIADFSRFKTKSSLSSYLGLVPSLEQSGESKVSGPITKCGNGHVRKLIIEACWHHVRHLRLGSLEKKLSASDERISLLATKANLRLHERARYLFSERKLNSNKAIVALAREMTVWIWRLGQTAQSL
jgi:transposase